MPWFVPGMHLPTVRYYKEYTTGEAIQAATLKTIMGKECRKILAHLELSDADAKDSAMVRTY